MTPEKQRIAIAEICGWSNIHQLENSNTLMGWWSGRPKASLVIPNYPCSLDAMHEAEQVLSDKSISYVGYLEDTTRYHLCTDNLEIIKWRFISATAAQRAEAFLKTFGKWED